MAFNLSALAAASTQLRQHSAFAGIVFNEYNRIGHDGDGRLVISLSGADPRKVKSQLVVIADFEKPFTATRRSFYMQAWKPGQETSTPDCQSADGLTPDAASPKPQSATCKACPHGVKDSPSKCSFRKTLVLFLATATDSGIVVDTSTAFSWDASSLSLFPKMDEESNSAGVFEMVKLLNKADVTVEMVVFELGFHQGSKAPVLTVHDSIEVDQALNVIARRNEPEVQALITYNQEKANKPSSGALPAPARQAAIAMDTPRAAAMAEARAARPAPATPAAVIVPEEELYVATVAVVPEVPAETEEEREEREMEEKLAARKATRAAAANKPAQTAPIVSQAVAPAMPRPVTPPTTAAAGPVAQAAPASAKTNALAAFGAARKAI